MGWGGAIVWSGSVECGRVEWCRAEWGRVEWGGVGSGGSLHGRGGSVGVGVR